MSDTLARTDDLPPAVERITKPTFVSPVSCDVAFNRGQRVLSYRLFLVQAGGSPITLEYHDRPEARQARGQLLHSPTAFAVPSMSLFNAIVESLTL